MSSYGARMSSRDRWNERYAQPGRRWMPETPSEWLVAHERLLHYVFAFQDSFERELARFEPR